MSEEKSTAPDISRVISVIMQNPEIIEKISALMKNEGREGEATESQPPQKEEAVIDARAKEAILGGAASGALGASKRTRLLTALKPYVKGRRAEAIDSVIAIADIIDMMRR